MSRSRQMAHRKQPIPRGGRNSARILGFSLVVAAIGVATIWIGWRWVSPAGPQRDDKAQPVGLGKPFLDDERAVFAQYGRSDSCEACHEEEYKLWQDSNHGLAERPVEPVLDRVAFDPARSFRYGRQTTEVRWTNGIAEVTSEGLSRKLEPHAVARVIGNDPLRQFLVPFPGGRFQTLEASYDPRSNQWFNVYGNEDREPGEWGHWTGRGMNWNDMCASCHNTRVRKNYDPASDTYHTTMAEPTVGCESCHGPLQAHNQSAKAIRQIQPERSNAHQVAAGSDRGLLRLLSRSAG